MSKHLVLVRGASHQTVLTLAKEDLQRHPDSLFAAITTQTSSSAAAGSNASGIVSAMPVTAANSGNGEELTLNLDDLPDNPCSSWSEAPGIITALYKQGYAPAAALQRELASGTPREDLMTKLSGLLSYLNLPGPLHKWLPPLDVLEIKQACVLAFNYYCWETEQAEAAAGLICAYKPHSEPGRQLRYAVFIVEEYTPANSTLPCLQVYAVAKPTFAIKWGDEVENISKSLIFWGGQANGVRTLTLEDSTFSTAVITPLQGTVASLHNAPAMCPSTVAVRDKEGLIGMDHPVFGEKLLNALKAALDGAACIIMCGKVTSRYQPYPVWMIKW